MSALFSLESLNPQQRKAVETVQGRVLVLAGAGSGKTSVLTMRMAHLINNHSIPAEALLGLTFTNKAAAEMRHRVAKWISPSAAKKITLSTFHSFCLQILRQEIHRLGYTPQFSIYDEGDVHRLITIIARDILRHDGEMPSLAPTISAINAARSRGLNADEISGTGSSEHDRFTREVYQRLQDSLRAYNALDFDQLLLLTVELFERFPDVLERYQDRYRYIMIDEYQDTNPIQCRLALLLASKYGNLCVVGDDDQSIYGWRGADVKNILEFEGATVIKLEQNYRSTNAILQAANAVISCNSKRHDKQLWSTQGEGDPIEVFHTGTEEEEAEAVVYRMAQMREKLGLRWSDFAILYRSNALSRHFEQSLLKYTWHEKNEWMRGIPYQIFGGLEFYERKEVKDLLAYLRGIVNPNDQEALLRIINQPRRGIGDAALDAITSYNRSAEIPLWDVLTGISDADPAYASLAQNLSSKALEGVKSFVEIVEEAKERFSVFSLAEAMTWLIGRINYDKAIDEEVKSTQMRQFKKDNVGELVSALEEYGGQSQREGQHLALSDFIATTLLRMQKQNMRDDKEISGDKVSLLTFHSAKGLEFTVCFLVGMEDHIIPHERSLAETGEEEERRLMYVALTRAKRHCIISMSRFRKRMGKENSSRPSRFLFEIPQQLLRKVSMK